MWKFHFPRFILPQDYQQLNGVMTPFLFQTVEMWKCGSTFLHSITLLFFPHTHRLFIPHVEMWKRGSTFPTFIGRFYFPAHTPRIILCACAGFLFWTFKKQKYTSILPHFHKTLKVSVMTPFIFVEVSGGSICGSICGSVDLPQNFSTPKKDFFF